MAFAEETRRRHRWPVVSTAVWRAGGGYRWLSVSVLLAGLAIWMAVTGSGLVSPIFLPSPGGVWDAFVILATDGYRGHSLLQHVGLSLITTALGFGSGALAGTLLGLGMGYSGKVNRLFDPLIEFFRPLPQLSYLILLTIWLGIGETPQVVMLFLTALPVATIAARDGVKVVPLARLQAARSLGATEWQLFAYVIVPSALPSIFTGCRLAIGIVYATLIAAEMISGTAGLGWVILDAERVLLPDVVFVGAIILGLTGLTLSAIVLVLERRTVHWAGRD